jgi:hypothetical protein
MIKLDSPFGKSIGFTSDKFAGSDNINLPGSYLWKKGNRILISAIISINQGQGNLSALFRAIKEKGYRIAIPTPLPRMQAILEAKGFVPHQEIFSYDGTEYEDEVEVWEEKVPDLPDVSEKAKP